MPTIVKGLKLRYIFEAFMLEPTQEYKVVEFDQHVVIFHLVLAYMIFVR